MCVTGSLAFSLLMRTCPLALDCYAQAMACAQPRHESRGSRGGLAEIPQAWQGAGPTGVPGGSGAHGGEYPNQACRICSAGSRTNHKS